MQASSSSSSAADCGSSTGGRHASQEKKPDAKKEPEDSDIASEAYVRTTSDAPELRPQPVSSEARMVTPRSPLTRRRSAPGEAGASIRRAELALRHAANIARNAAMAFETEADTLRNIRMAFVA